MQMCNKTALLILTSAATNDWKMLIDFATSRLENLVAKNQADELSEAVINLGVTKSKLAAIKQFRQETASTLADSKTIVEDYFARHNLEFKQQRY